MLEGADQGEKSDMGDATRGSTQHPVTTHSGPPAASAPSLPAAPRGSRGALWLGIIAIVAGVAGLTIAFLPAPFELRMAFVIGGIVVAIGGVVAAIIALRKSAPKGVALTGLILSAVVAVITAAFLVLSVIAEYQIEAMVERNAEEQQSRLAQEQAEETAIFEQSEWLSDARAEAVKSDFAAVDAATLEEILAAPYAYAEQGIVVDVSQILPLTSDSMAAEGLCLTEATIAPADGSELERMPRIGIVDRGTAEHCEFIDGPFGTETDAVELGGFIENFGEKTRVWLAPSGTVPVQDEDDLPLFTLMRVVE